MTFYATPTSDFFHTTPDCPPLVRGRASAAAQGALLRPLQEFATAEEAAAAVEQHKACPHC